MLALVDALLLTDGDVVADALADFVVETDGLGDTTDDSDLLSDAECVPLLLVELLADDDGVGTDDPLFVKDIEALGDALCEGVIDVLELALLLVVVDLLVEADTDKVRDPLADAPFDNDDVGDALLLLV